LAVALEARPGGDAKQLAQMARQVIATRALAAESDQRAFLDLAVAGVVDPDLGGFAAGGDEVEVALVDAHLVGADDGFGGACGHQAAQFLDGEPVSRPSARSLTRLRLRVARSR
jgi:hypothetical protein